MIAFDARGSEIREIPPLSLSVQFQLIIMFYRLEFEND